MRNCILWNFLNWRIKSAWIFKRSCTEVFRNIVKQFKHTRLNRAFNWSYEPNDVAYRLRIYYVAKWTCRASKLHHKCFEKKKNWIYSPSGSIEAFVLFMKKSDTNLRFYIDYRKLNEIIIKNKYSLLFF